MKCITEDEHIYSAVYHGNACGSQSSIATSTRAVLPLIVEGRFEVFREVIAPNDVGESVLRVRSELIGVKG